MKNTLVRVSVLVLALAGFGASAALNSHAASTKHTILAGAGGSMANCGPNSPNACGID